MDLLLHLRGFTAVADEMSVSEAALELGVDQPLLSRRLRALERELGVELIDRGRRQIALTPAGTALLPRARHLVDQADHLLRSVRRFDRDDFVVALPQGCAPAPLARLVALLETAGVGVRLAGTAEEAPGSGAWLVEECDAAAATWATPLGAAGAPGTERGPASVPLGTLRPRRGTGTGTGTGTRTGTRTGAAPATVLALPRDLDDPSGRLARAADRAGISPSALRRAEQPLAVAEVMAGRGTLVCARHEAETYGLTWAAFVDPVLRGHHLVERQPLPAPLAAGPVRDAALELVGAALSAAPGRDTGRGTGTGETA